MSSNANWESEVERLLQHMYPDEWSYTRDENDSSIHHYFIHFPEIEISNSKGNTHTILDLYIRIRFYEGGLLRDIMGNRATFNQAEFESKYSHSHLSTTVVENATWGGFCMGSEVIVTDIAELQKDGFESRLFEIVLYELDIFIRWESLEGGPYRKIENIKRRDSMPNVYNTHIEDAYKRYVSKYSTVNFSIQTSPPKIIIDPFDPEFMDQILPIIPYEHRVLRDTTTGEFFLTGSTRVYDDQRLYFKFKDQEVIRTIQSNENEEENKWYPHPEYLREIGKRLERKLTLHAFSKRTGDEGESNSCIIAGVMVENI